MANFVHMDSDSTALRAARKPRWTTGSLEATRQSLVTRLRDHGDHDGWQQFFDAYGGVIHGLAIKAGLNGSEADEALQETLLSVAHEMPGFRYDPARGSFKGWLFQIARRRVADQFRKRARLQKNVDPMGDGIGEVADPAADSMNAAWEEEWRQNQLQLAVDRVKQKVSAGQWQMFDLATIQGCPTDRICEVLGINRAQLYMARMRVGRMLKAEVAALGAE
jgi:RNA polymerase sigma-70 factor (ECF subfamily)